MPAVWPTLLDLSRNECKRILRKLELEAYAGVISVLRAQRESHQGKERSSWRTLKSPYSSEWSIEGRRLVPLMPRLVPQTAFTVTTNAVANAAVQHNASLPMPAETASKEVVVCYSYTSTTSSAVVLKEVPKAIVPVSKTITVPVSVSPKMSNIMQSIANSLPPHMSPVKITFTKPSTQTTNRTTQKVIIVTTSPNSTFMLNILSKSHNYAAVTKLVPTSEIASTTQKPPVIITASLSSLVSSSSSGNSSYTSSTVSSTVAVTAVVSSTPSVVMSTVAQGVSTSAIKMASTRLPSPKSSVSDPTQILTQQPVAQPSSVFQQQQPQQSLLPPGIKPTIQIKQESGVNIITQQVQPSKILPKPVTATLPTSSNSPIMVVSSNGAIMTTKLVTTPTGTQATYTRPTVSPSLGRVSTTPGAATYVKSTSGSIITVVPKSLAIWGGKIISSNIVSGMTTKITTIPMTSKPNLNVVRKTTGKGTTIQGLPGKNVTTLLNAGGEKTLQTVPTEAKPAIITATRLITKMIVTQPKGIGSTVQPAAKLIPTKIVYGQQGKTRVLIKPKPVTFQATVVSEQTRQLVTETLRQASRVAEAGNSSSQEGKEGLHRQKRDSPESPSIAVVESELVAEYITTESNDEGTEIAFPPSSQPSLPAPTAFTAPADPAPTCGSEGEVEEMDTLDPQTGLFYRSALTQSQSTKQQKLSQPQLEQTQLQVKTLQCFQTKQKQTIHLQADQLQHKLTQMPQLSIRHQKLTPLQQEQAQPKPDAQHTQHPVQLPALMAQPPQTVVQVLAVKTTQQLPKMQQAPNQPKIYMQPQTPQSQMALPTSSEKQPASQVEQPIITQGSSPPTVTKITGGSSVPKPTSPVASISPIQASEKTAVSDILQMSLMEAQIDTNVEQMVVDPPKQALATGVLTGEAGALLYPRGGGRDAAGVAVTGQFVRIQNVGQKKAEESNRIQAILQYAIPCHSSSNVVVEPSGLLELNNFTSQQLDDDETAMEKDVDNSTEDGTEPSPSQSSAEQS
uniref:EMSY n=1 Tax=Cricetulus griseus TaxID=10029 RepID=A0A8C2M3V3_CRIGR